MTRTEAQARCTELNDAAGGEPGVRWMPRETSPGEWTTVRLRIPGLRPTGPLTTGQESRPRPDAADPRPLVNPNWGAG
ncbi:MAG: hypothetical protein QOJ63_1787 [Solirubrobacteraceae bacterium]|jgi:hypothetical protein|nr:hypothetical protein [Solirubrobacteraceae bacterium]